ncbi:MAG: aspartate aminotransferase family protein [Gemmatimonadota bacterium]
MSHLSPVLSRAFPDGLVAVEGEGARIRTEDGRSFLDFTAGIGVTNTGHCHPAVVEAIREQAGRLIHGQANIVSHEPLRELTGELAGLVPPGLDTFFFANSGAESVEAAVKLAKQATGRTNVIVFSGSFHGRTHMAMSMTTSKTIYRGQYQPLPSGVFVAPFPNAYRWGWEPDRTAEFCISELEFLLHSQTAPEETAAVVIEPILGEGGYVVPPPSFLKELRDLCGRHDLLLVADEVQSGFGRTGRWFAFQHFGVVPDVICMAKGMGSGMPISAVAASAELWQAQATGSHGGTYGANAVACAAATATIRAIRDEGLLKNAERQGERLLESLAELQASRPELGDVRGIGLMVATEFSRPDGSPWPERARSVTKAAFEEGLLLLVCGTFGNVVRWVPPLTITDEELDEALTAFEHALERSG